MALTLPKIHYCQSLCTRPQLSGTKKFIANKLNESMYDLGYCHCDTCNLYFTHDAQRSERGFIRYCKCCHGPLRVRAKHKRRVNKTFDAKRDAKRY